MALNERQLNHQMCNDICDAIAQGANIDEVPAMIGIKGGESTIHWLKVKMVEYPELSRQVALVQKLVAETTALQRQIPPTTEVGKPKAYSEPVALAIAECIAAGESFREIAKRPGYPTVAQIRRWVKDHPEFDRLMWSARREAAQQYADEITAIADNEHLPPGSRKIRIDTRQWVASKLLKEYSDRMTVQGDAENPLTAVLAAVDGRTMGPPGKR